MKKSLLQKIAVGGALAIGLFTGVQAGDLLASITGSYSTKRSCEQDSHDSTKSVSCNYPIQPDTLSIAPIGLSKATIRITTMQLRWTSDEPTPFYCDFEGEAEVSGNRMVLRTDRDGEPVHGLALVVDKHKIRLVDNEPRSRVGFYCGEHASLNGLQFDRQKRAR